jgi:hypothetical protein
MIFLQNKKAQDAIDTGTARFFLVRIGLNQWRSVTSPFHYQYRDSFLDTPEYEAPDTEYDITGDVMEELVMGGLDEMYRSIPGTRYEAIIIMMYHANGSNYSEVGRQLDMKHTTIRKIYLRGIEKLKLIVNNRIKELKNGIIDANSNIDTLISEWDIMGGSDKQRTLSLASEIFKNGYFETA